MIAEDKARSEPTCINCGANRNQQPCDEHYYSKVDYLEATVEYLLDLIESRTSDFPTAQSQNKKPKKIMKKSTGGYRWKT